MTEIEKTKYADINFNGDPKYLDGDHFICSSPKVYKSILKSVKPYFKA